MSTGTLAEYYPDKGYGYIEPSDGTCRVFVHADDFGGQRDIAEGILVRFSSIQGRNGPKAYNVGILTDAPSGTEGAQSSEAWSNHRADIAERVGRQMSELQSVSYQVYAREITDALISKAPDISASQISEVCKTLTTRAARRGWLMPVMPQ
jgi:cold shock protein